MSDLESYLPHRPPFLFIDSVEVEGEKIIAHRTWKAEEPFFAGHFPLYPVVPGVLLVESMAQAGGVGAKKMGVNPTGTFFFAKIKSARFRRQVRPGETVRMEIENIKATAQITHQTGKGFVGEELALEVEWLCIAGEDVA